MNKKKQRRIRQFKRERRGAAALMDENQRLREDLLRAERECQGLRDACANLVIERDAADGLVREIQEGKHR
jgi:hypothetical protein